MGKYMVELYLPRARSGRAVTRSGPSSLGGRDLPRRSGRALSAFVPGDELRFLLYEGPSAEAVAAAVQRAAISFERIVEAAVDDGQDG
jgi:hypothetical protein